MEPMTLAAARRAALAAQGLGGPHPDNPGSMRQVQGQIDHRARLEALPG